VSGLHVSVSRRQWRSPVGGVFNIVLFTLIGLKLGGVISWPWSMVLLPLWFTLGVLFIVGLGIATAVLGARVSQYVRDRRSGEPAALLVPNRREPN
jgi:ABC-type polysaccharide/polyol phosphate export permease